MSRLRNLSRRAAVGLLLVAGFAGGCQPGRFADPAHTTNVPGMNALHIIQPYWHSGTWVFDDDRFGLSREPFVAGADTVISRMVEHIPNARAGFRLLFSTNSFPGAQLEVTRTSEGDGRGGTYYRAEQFKLDAWLCPALLHYFPQPPAKIFAKAEPLAR